MFITQEAPLIPNPIVIAIEDDVREFVEQELVIYKRDPNNKRLDDSVIVNFALFNLEALKYQNGYDQIMNLMADHHNQTVGLRLKQLLHTLYIRYGVERVIELSKKVLSSMNKVYDIDNEVLGNLDESYNTFWLQPFVRKAYSDIVNSISVPEEK